MEIKWWLGPLRVSFRYSTPSKRLRIKRKKSTTQSLILTFAGKLNNDQVLSISLHASPKHSIRVSPPKWLLQTFTNNRAYLVCKTNVLSDSSLRPLNKLFINRLVDYKHLFTNFLWVWLPESQWQLFRPRHDIANFINDSVLFVANFVFIIKYEFRRIYKDRKKIS